MTAIKLEPFHQINTVSPLLYGIFFEDINYAGDGGLYAELIANRSFEYYDRNHEISKHSLCWEAVGGCSFRILDRIPLSREHTHYAFPGLPEAVSAIPASAARALPSGRARPSAFPALPGTPLPCP